MDYQIKSIKYLILTILMFTFSLECKEQHLKYAGQEKGVLLTIEYKIKTRKDTTQIHSIINTEKIQENHTSILNNHSESLDYMKQYTYNEVDQEFFEWELSKKKDKLNIIYKNYRFNDQFETNIPAKKNPISLQGLLLLIQKQDLFISKTLTANLLIPWKTILPMKLTVIDEEKLNINSKSIETYKINAELNFKFINKLLPNTILWVKKDKPHILIQQKGFNQLYTIVDID